MFKFLENRIDKTKKYSYLLEKIRNIDFNLKKLSAKELKEQTNRLKSLLNNGYSLEAILPEAFATVKEATKRALGIEMFDVQILGGIALHEGKIAEMKTGEGKTLVSILPAYLNCLNRPGVHIVTVNDYLAKRDAEWVTEVYNLLDIRVGLIQQDMHTKDRQKNYNCDVIYLTNSELGFDYLRDNMAIDTNNVVQKTFSFAIIDEVDSILIDEARTPLIISGPSETKSTKYKKATELANVLKNTMHYEIDEKNRNITLTDNGIIYCETFLKTANLYNIQDPWAQYILNALKAKELFLRNRHYILRGEEIVIVDEFTGRIMNGRRWSDGLHQAIESKEYLPIQKENKTLASITYQNLFLLYEKLSGMTGTAKTEETELDKIYNLAVITIPTNKQCIRKDFFDLVYKTEFSKWQAVAQECFLMNKKGRPVLVGTTNIEKSEMLAKMLEAYKLKYNLLNARPKNVNKEAEIIAQAGRKYALTISTNMAGRGTDIILGGNAKAMTKLIIISFIKNKTDYKNKRQLTSNILNQKIVNILDEYKNKIEIRSAINENLEAYLYKIITNKNLTNIQEIYLNEFYSKILKELKIILEKEKREVIKLGGLHVIGTERHESRRIDNQLKGRAGRQGDPGSSRFFLSLDDQLLRIFGGDKIKQVMQNLDIDDNTPIESTILNKSLDNAQKKVESYFYDIRKQLFEYDAVINTQRQAIYSERKKILETKFIRNCLIEYGQSTINEILSTSSNNDIVQYKTFERICKLFNIPLSLKIEKEDLLNVNTLKLFLYEQLYITYDLKEAYLEQLKPGLTRQLEKYYLLEQIDQAWQEHIERMSVLRETINWRSYGQQDPLIEYKNEAFNLFLDMTSYIRQTVVYLMMRSRLITNLNKNS
uniref:Protein translocase subunit SecA n=1 Tax=Porolithon onkodes TaxID=231751 RepID=A0A2Z2KXS7_9FLOR|nr:preprotein translocase subunit SecA [Porolithon onkodes]ASB29805.1 preprotein translocase subunit SecA [Porolithon onkodes]